MLNMIPCVCATLKLRSWGLCGCRVDNSVGSSVSIAQRACRCYLGAFSPVVQVWQCVAIMIHPTSSIYQPLYRWSTKQRVQLPYSISSRTVSQYVDTLCLHTNTSGCHPHVNVSIPSSLMAAALAHPYSNNQSGPPQE